jgi:LysR family transcriptional regulator, low CO2-responsive transcriptional regulator
VLQVTSRRLEVFVAVVDEAGFGAAAAALNIAQPSVSAHIRALESKVGAPLFEAHPRHPPRLTEAGRTVYAYARETLARAHSVSQALGRDAPRVRFAAQRFIASSLLQRPLEAFADRFPEVDLIAHTGTFEEVHALFTNGAVDLVFMLSPKGEVPGLQTTAMGRYRLAFIAAPDHPLARQQQIAPEVLMQHPFVSAYRGSYFGRTLAQMLNEAGLHHIQIRSQAQEMTMLREMVLAGMGISFSLHRSVHKELAAGTLVELDVDLDPMYLVLSYAKNPRTAVPEIDVLVDMVRRSEGQVP